MISGKISAGEAFVMVSCETEKLEQGLRDVHQKLERETAHIASINRQLELEFKVDGVENFKDELRDVKSAVDASSASATKWAIACSTIVPTMWNGMKNALSSIMSQLTSVAASFARLSGETGVSVEKLSEWEYAVKSVGGDADTVRDALLMMGETLAQGAEGEAGKIVARLGVDFEALSTKSTQAQFETLFVAISLIEDPLLRASAA